MDIHQPDPDRLPDPGKCPELVIRRLVQYIDEGVPLGGFLTSVITNDLMGAFTSADLTNMWAMPHIMAWVYNYVPATAKGSFDAYSRWLEAHQIRKEQHAKDSIQNEKTQ